MGDCYSEDFHGEVEVIVPPKRFRTSFRQAVSSYLREYPISTIIQIALICYAGASALNGLPAWPFVLEIVIYPLCFAGCVYLRMTKSEQFGLPPVS